MEETKNKKFVMRHFSFTDIPVLRIQTNHKNAQELKKRLKPKKFKSLFCFFGVVHYRVHILKYLVFDVFLTKALWNNLWFRSNYSMIFFIFLKTFLIVLLPVVAGFHFNFLEVLFFFWSNSDETELHLTLFRPEIRVCVELFHSLLMEMFCL